MESDRTIGPLERGHDPVTLVLGVAREVVPADWRCLNVWLLRGERVKFMLMRPDHLVQQFEITYVAINAGVARQAVRDAVAELSKGA